MTLGVIVLPHLFSVLLHQKGGSAMRETLESALVFLEKAAAVVAIVVPAVRGVASIASVNLTETK